MFRKRFLRASFKACYGQNGCGFSVDDCRPLLQSRNKPALKGCATIEAALIEHKK
jgi:hypothetical protein